MSKKVDKKVEKKKDVKRVEKANIINTEVIDFGDMKIEQTNFSDGTSAARIV